MSLECYLTNLRIDVECPITDCMWHSHLYQHKCGADERHDITPEAVAKLKGVKVDVVLKENRKASSEIKNILILDEYVTWAKEKVTYNNIANKLLEEKFDLTQTKLKHKELRLNHYLIGFLLQRSVFKKYKKSMSITCSNSVETILSIKPKLAERVRSAFKRLKDTPIEVGTGNN